ncbi:hypothetical protein ACWENQ_45580 [Nonomuraea sp. NPDC004354]
MKRATGSKPQDGPREKPIHTCPVKGCGFQTSNPAGVGEHHCAPKVTR